MICLLNVLYILVKYHENFLKGFKVMVRTKFYNFWRLGEITHGPSQLELSFLHPIPVPNAHYNLTKFRENSSKGIGIMRCTIMRLWTDKEMEGWMDSMLIAISTKPICWGIMKFNKRSWWYSYINLNAKIFTFIWKNLWPWPQGHTLGWGSCWALDLYLPSCKL